ncbi:hypothetical protein HPB50_000739 [Hyalomma asiaticum]|uniref:Uncharacterized protein n=1 Tax=Hyalomma asiaticum TaxID=266040 RepID=A0ACB7SWF9_HYAAI|nr:hypothetical protein HPB50_000739 [Hyalomma asiaticum]
MDQVLQKLEHRMATGLPGGGSGNVSGGPGSLGSHPVFPWSFQRRVEGDCPAASQPTRSRVVALIKPFVTRLLRISPPIFSLLSQCRQSGRCWPRV